MVYATTSERARFDFFVVEHSLAYEMQGQQHYNDDPFFGKKEQLKERFDAKCALCKEAGISMVEVCACGVVVMRRWRVY